MLSTTTLSVVGLPSSGQLLRFMVLLVVLLTTARLLGYLFARIGQPQVIGELTAGIVLGPSFFAAFFPWTYHAILAPGDPGVSSMLEAFSWLSMTLLLMFAGFETDLRMLRRVGRIATYAAVFGMLIPFAAGAALGYFLAEATTLSSVPQMPLVFALFVAVMMSVSAVPVIVRILLDLNLMRTRVGTAVFCAAIANDVVAWIFIAAGSGFVAGHTDPLAIEVSVAGVVLFVFFAYYLGGRVVGYLASWTRRLSPRHWVLAVSLTVSLGLAAITQLIGVHAVLGAFVGGILVKESLRARVHEMPRLGYLVMRVLAPVFFAASGLKVDLTEIFNPALLGVGLTVILVASATKLVGGTLGAWLGGLPFWQASAVGSGLNARGAMEIIVATLAFSLGIITQQLYSIIVVMAIVTSMMTPTLMKWTLARSENARESPGWREKEA